MTSPLPVPSRDASDLVKRLRGWSNVAIRRHAKTLSEAAARIEALEAAASTLRNATLKEVIAILEVGGMRQLSDRESEILVAVRALEAVAAQPSQREAELVKALEDIALLDEADGHLLSVKDAFQAVAIATKTLGKHPATITAERFAAGYYDPIKPGVQDSIHATPDARREEAGK